ncbi:unnamed protein product [Cylindrotheca closterium]|uniref:Uncharacterized protein n=1 Tax=Cylindrotheca closterium TaxID=2856 RepID=A0AAD2CLE3_9STRA|nr:unnamed protein product [Cylindrotheca closterium]
MIRARATFLSRPVATNKEDGTKRSMLQPFINGGSLDESIVERHEIEAIPLDCNANDNIILYQQSFEQKGMIRVNLAEYLKQHFVSCQDREGDGKQDDDSGIRSAASDFLRSDQGQSLLLARFAQSTVSKSSQQQWHIRPTHVTHRTVPPDGMSLVHIDYPQTTSLGQLTSEWWRKWEPLLSDLGNSPEQLERRFVLVGVVTLWVFLPQDRNDQLQDHPLLVADTSTLSHENDTTTYQVVGSKTTRHSVGVFYNPSMKWYHATSPNMTWGDAWLFDTQKNPHVSVNLMDNLDFRRQSCEVRCLILQKRKVEDPS